MRAQIGAGEEYVAHHSRVQDEEHQPTRDVMQLKRQFHERALASNDWLGGCLGVCIKARDC